jgi:hypothetical protein
MKVSINKLNSDEFFELEINSEETISSIKRRIIKENQKLDKYKDYEYYEDTIEQRSGKLKLDTRSSFIIDDFTVGNLKGNQTVEEVYSSLKNKTIYQALCPQHDLRFVLSDAAISFEFVNSNIVRNRFNNVYTIGHLKQYFTETFKASCSILLKKKGCSEYLSLKDDEIIPYRDIFVQFDSNIELPAQLKTTLSIPLSIQTSKVTEVQLLNIHVHAHPPTNLQEHFEFITIANKEKPQSPQIHYKYFIATGAIATLLGIVTTSYLFKNHLSESAMHSPSIEQSLGIKPFNLIPLATLGTIAGSAIGWVASLVYEYLNTKDISNHKPNER